MAKKSVSIKNFDKENIQIGKTYYNVMKVLQNKIVSSLLERKDEASIDLNQIKKIGHIVNSEIEMAKSWGYNQIKLNNE